MLIATNIVKIYGTKKVLDNVNMNISKCDIYGFIGKNGAGKTTFNKVLLVVALLLVYLVLLFEISNIIIKKKEIK